LNRRHFIKYAVGTATIVGASALGLDFLLSSRFPSTSRPTSSVTTSSLMPPTISNFSWQPTRIVNDKVYDATIAFDIESTSPITSLKATLEGYAPTIPPRAYPAESLIALQLGSLPKSTSVTTYSANVANLKGGKQYKLSAQAENSAGRRTAEFETPYVREFENISGKDNLLVGAIYNPWFENPCVPGHFCHWSELQADFQKGTTPLGTPLLGLYNSNDPMVIAKHIDWATAYGIDFFLFDFWGQDSAPWRFTPLLQHPLIRDIKFAFSYATQKLAQSIKLVDFNDPSTYSALESDFVYMAQNYFSHPSYLRINGRPLVQIYLTFAIKGSISEPLKKLRQRIRDLGFEIFLIGDQISYGDRINPETLKAFDAISDANDYIPPTWKWQLSASEIREEYSRWESAAHAVGVELVPFAYPGYDDSHLVDRTESYGHVPKSREFFASNLKSAIEFADTNRIVGIVEFNGWGENTYEEPSVEDGFKYLETLRDTLAGH